MPLCGMTERAGSKYNGYRPKRQARMLGRAAAYNHSRTLTDGG